MNVPKQIEYARLEHESDNNYRFVEADGIVREYGLLSATYPCICAAQIMGLL